MDHKRRLARFVILLLGVMGLIWLLDRIGLSTVGGAFRRVGIEGMSAILALALVEALLDAWSLRQAALDRIPLGRTLIINQTGSLLNMAVPVEGGEILKAALLSRRMKGGATEAVLVWNLASRLAKSSVIFIATVAALFFLPAFRGKAGVCLGFAVLNLAVYGVFTLILRFGGVGRLFGVVSRLPFLKGKRTERFASRAQKAERATSRFRREHPSRYAAVLASQIGARTAGLMTTCLAFYFVNSGSPILLGLLVFATMELAGYIVALLPTRIGTTEGSAFLIFQFLGLDGGLGTVLQLALRLKQLLIAGTFSAIGAVKGITR